MSIHGAVAKMLSAAPAETSRSATVVTLRNPKRFIRAAANGAVSP